MRAKKKDQQAISKRKRERKRQEKIFVGGRRVSAFVYAIPLPGVSNPK